MYSGCNLTSISRLLERPGVDNRDNYLIAAWIMYIYYNNRDYFFIEISYKKGENETNTLLIYVFNYLAWILSKAPPVGFVCVIFVFMIKL